MNATAVIIASLFAPLGVQAAPLQDPEKPMCVGVQSSPLWGDKGEYTGPCRYGAPLGTMTGAVTLMDRRRAVGTAREYGMSAGNATRLQGELDTIARLPFMTGVARLKRHARAETRAAKDQDDSDKPSWLRSAAVNCAVWGSLAGTGENVYQAVAEHKPLGKEVAKAAAIACALAVISGPVKRWLKSRGYDLDD